MPLPASPSHHPGRFEPDQIVSPFLAKATRGDCSFKPTRLSVMRGCRRTLEHLLTALGERRETDDPTRQCPHEAPRVGCSDWTRNPGAGAGPTAGARATPAFEKPKDAR